MNSILFNQAVKDLDSKLQEFCWFFEHGKECQLQCNVQYSSTIFSFKEWNYRRMFCVLDQENNSHKLDIYAEKSK